MSRSEKQWNVVFALGVGLNALVLFVTVVRTDLRTLYFNADNLYIPTLVADLTRWHGHFSDWHLTPAPYYFPDIVLYGLVSLIVQNVEASQYLTGFLQLFLVIIAARVLLRRLDAERAGASALIAPAMAAWIAFYNYDGMPLVYSGVIVSAHGGALLSTVTVFALCVRPAARSHWFGAVAVVAISVLTAMSDSLFTAASSGVLAITTLGEIITRVRTRNLVPSRLLLHRCALAAAAGIVGYALQWHLGLGSKLNITGSFDVALETRKRLWESPDAYARYAVTGLAAVASVAAVVLTNRWPARAGLRILARWQLLVTAAVLGAIAYTGAYVDRFSLRYASLPCYFSVIFLAGLAMRVVRRPEFSSAWARRSMVALTGALLFGFAHNFTSIAHASISAPQRHTAQCVRDAAKLAGVDTVVSNYWNAKPLMLLSGGDVRVLQVLDNFDPYLWITSRGWYRDPHQLGILVVNQINRDRAIRVLRRPQSVMWCDDLELWVYYDDARARMTQTLRDRFTRTIAEIDASVPH